MHIVAMVVLKQSLRSNEEHHVMSYISAKW